MSKENNNLFANLKSDIPASIIVFFVAVPLCLGIALASGAPLFSGIIAGIVGGIIAGILSGSALGVSGPAAGLAAIVLTAIQDLGAFDIFLVAVVIGGLIQLTFGFLKLGIIGYYFPSSVIKGMLSGIGIVIFKKMIPDGLGITKDFFDSYSFSFANLQESLASYTDAISTSALIITGISLVILILWEQPFMKKIKLFTLIQAPLVVVILGVILNMIFASNPNLALTSGQVVNIPVAEDISGFVGLFSFPDFTAISNPAVWVTGITIAIVASLETLLCLEATDKLDPQKRVSPPNRELKAQGVANLVSGLIGGLPITQVIVRSSTNIQSGGRTKMAAILHGVILLVSVMIIPDLLNLIPLASLAAILFIVGYKLAKPSLFKVMYKQGIGQFLPFIVTIVAIVTVDLLVGIGLGLVVAIFFILWNNFKKPFLFEKEKDLKDGVIRLNLAEDVTFINKANIQRALTQVPDGSKVIIDASKSINIDLDVVEIIEEFEINAKFRNIDLEIIERKRKGVNNQIKEVENAFAQNGSVKAGANS